LLDHRQALPKSDLRSDHLEIALLIVFAFFARAVRDAGGVVDLFISGLFGKNVYALAHR